MNNSSVLGYAQERDSRLQAFGAFFSPGARDLGTWLQENVEQTSTLQRNQVIVDRNGEAVHRFFKQQLEPIRTTETLPEAIRANWPALARSGLSEDTYSRLFLIADKPQEWRGPGSKVLQGVSVSKFLRFWSMVKDTAREPELMLTPMGTLQAEWFKSETQFLEIEFRKNDDSVNFGLIDRSERFEGVVNQDQLLNILKGYRSGLALRWGPV